MPLEPRGRHAQDAPPTVMIWRCPACSVENSGPLELGCTACHSGTPGRYVGVDPPAPRKAQPAPVQSTEYVPYSTAPRADLVDVSRGFLEWVKPFRGKFDSQTEGLLYAAYEAGFIAATMQQNPQVGPPLVGSAESRTIIAALKLFIEDILPTAGEEIASGEFLSIPEVEKLIERLERTA